MKIRAWQLIAYSIFSGLLLNMGWTSWSTGPALLIAFIPILYVEDYLQSIKSRSVRFFFYSYLCFFTWNILSTWWISNASLSGMSMAVIFNSMFMSVVFWLFHFFRRKMGNHPGYISLIAFWLAFEFIHLRWELSWPWLNLGNGFANNISLIQWYEYTGVLGGSCWILIINILVFGLIKQYILNRSLGQKKMVILLTCCLLLFPIILSLILYSTYEEKKAPCKVSLIQPNIDPYNEKFGGLSDMEQLKVIITLVDSAAQSHPDFLVAPETTLDYPSLWEKTHHKTGCLFTTSPQDEDTVEEYRISNLKQLLKKYPGTRFVLGLSSCRKLLAGKKITPTARKFSDTAVYFDAFNTAILMDTSGVLQYYHKSKLVLGVEKMPFPKTLGFLEKLAINLGGTFGSLGTQNQPTVFRCPGDTLSVAPVICYELIYGEYITQFIHKGAHVIFIITNDGWWGNTPGYKHLVSYSRLRAVETRRSIARSANTGISCFINQRGDVISASSWWVPAIINGEINASNRMTIYTLYGDFIGRISVFLSLILILFFIVKSFKKP